MLVEIDSGILEEARDLIVDQELSKLSDLLGDTDKFADCGAAAESLHRIFKTGIAKSEQLERLEKYIDAWQSTDVPYLHTEIMLQQAAKTWPFMKEAETKHRTLGRERFVAQLAKPFLELANVSPSKLESFERMTFGTGASKDFRNKRFAKSVENIPLLGSMANWLARHRTSPSTKALRNGLGKGTPSVNLPQGRSH